MTAPARPLKPRQRLEGELNLLPSDVGLTSAALDDRIKLWGQLADERPTATEPQRFEHIKALALRAWITALSRKADKFRAEGDVTAERDILGRIKELKELEAAARAAAGLTVTVASGTVSANPAPEFGEWSTSP